VERLIKVIDCEVLEEQIKKKKIESCYVFCGLDEKLIKDSIELIVRNMLNGDFADLNYIKFDGNKMSLQELQNACETLPFFSDKKVVLVYRALFLSDREDRDSKKRFEEISTYIEDLPKHCVLIMYYVFEDEREKPSGNIKKLEKKCTIIKADKLKGEKLYKKVKDVFENRGKDIGKVELRFFCDNVDNNMDIIVNEVNKLIGYTEGREITKKDITDMFPQKSDNDIFDLVDFVSQKRPEKAIDVLNELIYRGENPIGILSMIQRQFKLLLNVKLGSEEGKTKEILAKELRLHPFIAEKLLIQSKKFSLLQLKRCLELCLNTEKTLKSSPFDKKTEMELLLISSVRV
jgi:DNA polymerase III subunit delta